MIVAKYKFNPSTYSDYLPVFNSGFSYTKSDVNNGDGTITRTIESNSLPTSMRFGETTSATDRSNSLLEILDMNTSNLTSMVNMFGYCKNLTSIVCNWNTSEVTDIREAFYNCSSLTTLNVNDWNTSNVTDMNSMFLGCSKLTSLDLNSWDTSQVTNMQGMFYNCKTLTSLNVRNWNTSKVTNMYYMFNGCSSLTSLDLSIWDTSQVTNMENMFYDCSSLTSLDISNWNISNVTNSYGIFDGCSLLRKVNLKYSNQSTVSKIHDNLPDRSSTTEGYILSLVDLTSDKNWEVLKFSHNEVYLPQPLHKVGDVKDRLYWDENKGHYCIEQNLTKTVFDGSDDEDWKEHYVNGNEDKSKYCYYPRNIPVYPKFATTDNVVLCDKLTWRHAHNWGTPGVPIEDEFLINANEFCVFKSSISTVSEFKEWISQNPITLIHPLETPNIIDLTEMNKKITFDTYLPNTSVDVTNLPLQPYKLLLENDKVRYKFTIEPSTLYTIQFNCLAKSTTNLTLDLGGTRLTVDPIIGVNHVQITTPSILASDRLSLIGTGIIINEVIVNKGNMNQYTKYFDGEQSVGELQEDGSYIIRISTDNYTGLWEGDL